MKKFEIAFRDLEEMFIVGDFAELDNHNNLIIRKTIGTAVVTCNANDWVYVLAVEDVDDEK